MNRRGFIGTLAAATVATIIPAREFLAKKREFSGDTIPNGNSICTSVQILKNFPTYEDNQEIHRQLISRNVQPHMRVRFRGTINPIRLTYVERLA